MKIPSDHMRTLKRRVDFLKSRDHKNSFDLAELGALEWALVNLQPAPVPPVATLFGSLPVYDTTPPAAAPVQPVKPSLWEQYHAAQPSVQEPVVFYRCNGCGHAYEQVHPTSCDCMEAGGFDRVDYYTTPPAAQTAVPDAFGTREGEHPQYIQGWNDCRAEMLKGMKP